MIPVGLWKLLHLFFAFSFFGSLIVAEWNGRAARLTNNWDHRALLFQIILVSSRAVGLGSLILLGVFGNLASVRLGYSMARDGWMHWANGLWIVAVLSLIFVSLPNARRLAEGSRTAAGGGSPVGFERALARWRFGNVVQSLLFLTMLTFMVFRWRS